MRARKRPIDGVWFGLALSVVLHAVVAPWLLSRSEAGSEDLSRTDTPSPPRPLPEDERMRLGIERSEHATINWLGFSDPTPHKALPSEVEQAALSIAPIGVPNEPSPAEASEANEPTPPADAPETPPVEIPTEQPAETTEPTEPAPSGGASVIELLPADDPLTLAEREPGAEFLPEPVQIRPEETTAPSVTEPAEKPTTPTESPASETPTAATPSAPSGSDDQPGLPSDRESSPTAREAAVTIDDWGKPAAGEGIEIIPRRPRWGATVSSLAWPRNPTVIIAFGRDGTARDVRFVTEGKRVLNTGSEEVDRILLNAVYNWRAKGAKIESLAEEGPGSVFTIRVHIRLRW
jgi:hypothetical protein